ncbi:hypothetical protein M9H77_28380 [Catharanthus roseus]|uniref:Uncharacterized protein n=1 Tax=Catharanthus roseus TaxID=4058 RepID=A0ACC0AGM0_CATRO|nr:hypothetical protein M9H77_28380 [Catharanthus roseus]
MMNSMLQEVDDMASVVIQEPSTSLSQMAMFAKKVQTIIRRCMVSIGGTLSCTPSQHNIQQTFRVQPSHRRPREHVMDRGAHGVKRGARRQPGRGARGGRPPIPPFPRHVEMERGEGSGLVEGGEGSGGGHPPINPFGSLNLDMPSFSLGLTQPSQSLLGGSVTLCSSPPPGLGLAPFQSPASTSLGFSLFCAPPPLGTVGSSTSHQPISQVSSSDDEERADERDDVQRLGFGHRVRKKTMRFTPSDWP